MQRTVNEIIEDLKQLQKPSAVEAKIRGKIARLKAEFMEDIEGHEVFDLGADEIESFDEIANHSDSVGEILFNAIKENDQYCMEYFSDLENIVSQINCFERTFFSYNKQINLLEELLDTDTE